MIFPSGKLPISGFAVLLLTVAFLGSLAIAANTDAATFNDSSPPGIVMNQQNDLHQKILHNTTFSLCTADGIHVEINFDARGSTAENIIGALWAINNSANTNLLTVPANRGSTQNNVLVENALTGTLNCNDGNVDRPAQTTSPPAMNALVNNAANMTPICWLNDDPAVRQETAVVMTSSHTLKGGVSREG